MLDSTETPESQKILDGKDLHFTFLVDRSGSMGGRRIEITKDALKLFMQSLPVGCNFSVIGFGSNPEFCHSSKNEKIWQYDDNSL